RDDLYPSALVSIRELAWLRLEESMTAGARGFAAQMQVAIEAFECAQAQLPPTSTSESSGTEEEAAGARAGRSASAEPGRRATGASAGPSRAARPTSRFRRPGRSIPTGRSSLRPPGGTVPPV